MILTIDALTVKYGSVVGLSRVSLKVAEGTIVAVVGANGAGKSTLMNTVAGLLRPTEGSIFLDETNLEGLSPESRARMGLSLVPEDRGILTELTVIENLTLAFAARRGFKRSDAFEVAFDRFPMLKDFRHRRAGELSGGQQQMLAIGRALVATPRLLLLDEPSLGLAPVVVDQLFSVYRTLVESGVTIVLVEQFARRAIAISDYAYVLKNHIVVAEGTPAYFAQYGELGDAYLGRELQR